MKIAIICGAGTVSGKEIISLELADGLRDAGKDVRFIVSSWGSRDFTNRLYALNIPFHRMRIGFISATLNPECLRMTIHQIVYWPALLYDYWRFLRRERPHQIVHTNWHHILLLWPFLKPQRDYFWVHEFVPNKPQYVRLFRRMSRRIRYFITVSAAVAASLKQIGVADDKIVTIHNGISDPSLGQHAKVSREGISIGIIGQIGAWKGHEDLLEAFAVISNRNANVWLRIFGIGSGAFGNYLRDRAKVLGVSSRIIWEGFVSERALIYSKIDVCVAPSRTDDPLPTSAIEAAFFGIPVVATDKGGLPEIVIDGETGFIVQSGNLDQLSDRLDALVQDAALRNRLGISARERALLCFARVRFIQEFVRLLSGTGSSKVVSVV